MGAPEWLRTAVAQHGARVRAERLSAARVRRLTGLPWYRAREIVLVCRGDGDIGAALDAWRPERERRRMFQDGDRPRNMDTDPAETPDIRKTSDEPQAPARPGLVVERAERTIEATASTNDDRTAISPEGQGLVRNLAELVREAEIDLTQWEVDGSVKTSTWATPIKVDGEARIVRSWYVSAKFRKRLDVGVRDPNWTPVRRVAREAPRDSMALAVLLPDAQIGYRWSDNYQRLVPLHDWNAIDAAWQLTKLLQPQHIQHLGDGMDFAPFSTKFQVPLALKATTQPALLTMRALLRWQREDCRGALMDYQGGNHEERSERAMVGTEYDGLTTAANPDGPPVLSFANLLGLADLDITWRAYGRRRWLFDAMKIVHGDKVRPAGGETVAAVLKSASHSVAFGHIHRLESASRTIHGTDERPRVITAISPGCLCRIDGAVPGMTAEPDWQHGMALVWWDAERRQEHVEPVPIHDGAIMYRGTRIQGDGQRLSREVADAIGWAQVAT